MENLQNNETLNQNQFPEPTVSGAYGHGWEIMKKNFPELLLVLFIQILLSVPMGFTSMFFNIQYIGNFGSIGKVGGEKL